MRTLITQVLTRDKLRTLLHEQREEVRSERERGWRGKLFAIGMVLRSNRKFERVYEQYTKEFEIHLTEQDVSVNDLGDGTLLKLFLEWLDNGGWEKLLDLIFKLL